MAHNFPRMSEQDYLKASPARKHAASGSYVLQNWALLTLNTWPAESSLMKGLDPVNTWPAEPSLMRTLNPWTHGLKSHLWWRHGSMHSIKESTCRESGFWPETSHSIPPRALLVQDQCSPLDPCWAGFSTIVEGAQLCGGLAVIGLQFTRQ